MQVTHSLRYGVHRKKKAALLLHSNYPALAFTSAYSPAANVRFWRILLKKCEIGLPQKFDQMTF